ncbi:4'-phosphopantetheinyl transferase superfamily protein [Streptosporangium sp. NBC_01755]|uniref:4'-phosphopantetheinyl transferase family protein n=1 Tax=Streptosporangium sp. NBC_01755 TaxID=2975949 RepID=UPI002DDA3148|nr:4'-phosphopantetheinyl transferase superfamily protein [Streptosporangium sp. NBC_01755]WSC99207.1 4'-phosphopantetheinyl transferase superfamily protein [Streptosporangium sp. NBC_01755]
MIEDLLPGEVMSSEAFDDSRPCALFLAEEAVISRSVEKRRREFTTARWCARDALGNLGYQPVPVLPGAKGAPIWPSGVVGSITHCAGYRAAVVARSGDITTLGIDAEPNKPLPSGILEVITAGEELRRVMDLLRRDPSVRWDRLLFSAKESVYKAWFPLAPLREPGLDFTEASITFDPVCGGFQALLLVEGPRLSDGVELKEFSGRWLVGRGLMITAIAVVAAPSVTGDTSGAPDVANASDAPIAFAADSAARTLPMATGDHHLSDRR